MRIPSAPAIRALALTLAKSLAVGAVLGLAATTAFAAWSMHRADKVLTQSQMVILNVSGSNFITTLSANRWSTAVVIQLFSPRSPAARLEDLSASELHERLALAIAPTMDANLTTYTNDFGARKWSAVSGAPPRFLHALSGPRTTSGTVWTEATYGWPTRCIAIPRALTTPPSPFSDITSGNFRIVWTETALSTAFFTIPTTLLSLAVFTIRPRWAISRRRARGLCLKCAYPLNAATRCPECGANA